MDVKGAKALSERLAEAARNVDTPRESGGLGRHRPRVRSPPLRRRGNYGLREVDTPRVPFDSLLASLRLGGRDFERVCKWALGNVPEYRQRLRHVWLWDDWPGHRGRSRRRYVARDNALAVARVDGLPRLA